MDLKQLTLLVLVIITPSIFIEAQTKTQAKEQSLFGAEEETLDRPVKVPDGALEILRKDEQVLRYLVAEQRSVDDLTTEPFLASEIHLDGPNETDLIVMGEGRLRGANVVTFWIFRKLPQGYRLVLKTTAAGLRVEHARWKGFRNISTGSPIAGSSIEIFYRFDGNPYQYDRRVARTDKPKTEFGLADSALVDESRAVQGQVQSSARPWSPTVRSHLAVNHVCNIAALAQELHHFLARPCHLRPSGFCMGVLLQPTNLAPVEYAGRA